MNTSVLGFLNFLTWAHKEKIVNDKIPDTKSMKNVYSYTSYYRLQGNFHTLHQGLKKKSWIWK